MQLIKNPSDPELITNLRAGRQIDETVRTLYRNCFSSLAQYVMTNNGSRQDAEDIFQEVIVSFIDLVQKDKFRGESSIKTFLFSLNRHLWLNELKRRGRALAREEKYGHQLTQTDQDVSQLIAGREAGSQLIKLMDRLGETCKKILLLYYYENLSIRDILANLHYDNEQVVRNKKYKCLKQLEQMVNDNPAVKQTLQNLLNG